MLYAGRQTPYRSEAILAERNRHDSETVAGGEGMKTPAFWYKSVGPRALLLLPLTLLYRAGFLWRRSRATPFPANVPVICVGNVVAGGSGKTPMALAVAAFL